MRFDQLLSPSPCHASPGHPRLGKSAGNGVEDAGRILRDCAIFEWSAPDPALATRLATYLAQAQRLGLHSGVTLTLHMQHNQLFIWELARAQPSAKLLTLDEVTQLCGILFLLSSEAVKGLHRPSLAQPLTEREIEILNWCKEGKTYADIADILAISAKTVDYHMSNAMRKLNVNDKLTAIVTALRKGLIDL